MRTATPTASKTPASKEKASVGAALYVAETPSNTGHDGGSKGSTGENALKSLYSKLMDVRAATTALASPLSDADASVQSMPDASPAKWHLAHTSWFFEAFVLVPSVPGYAVYDSAYNYLFNSYYEQVGARHPRPQRGMITRPSLDDILAYRAHVDGALQDLAQSALAAGAASLIELGLQHEQQHQELLLTDILYLFAQNPLAPAYVCPEGQKTLTLPQFLSQPQPQSLHLASKGGEAEREALMPAAAKPVPLQGAPEPTLPSPLPLAWHGFTAGQYDIGAGPSGFAYDNERPRHTRYMQGFSVASRPVTNGEWLAFMLDGGYKNPLFWLSDGWALVGREGWQAPLHWRDCGETWGQMTLAGLVAIDPNAPVTHISYYEADAFAAWAAAQWRGARLPREDEWEIAAQHAAKMGAGPESDSLAGAVADKASPLTQYGLPASLEALSPAPLAPHEDAQAFSGHVWQWTQSAYTAYPGFRPLDGAAGEYNGKFMSGQFVLRGGSCATPKGHTRLTYRNFFYPHQRWQFTGLRLARDL